MDNLVYRLATADDVESLTALRIAFLAEVSTSIPPGPELRAALTSYFARTLQSGEFAAYLAVADDRIVATSGLVYYHHPPSATNLHGCEAYVMNMYTLPVWRGRGIATALLEKLIEYARKTNSCRVSLHALPNARSIYLKAGFVPVDTEMRLDLRRNPSS